MIWWILRVCRGGAVWWILRVFRDLLNWVFLGVFRVSPPLRGVHDFVENPYMIFYVCITIISGRNKYLKISKSRQMRLASQDIHGILLVTLLWSYNKIVG